MNGFISRQAAIDAIGKVSDELYENIKKGATFPQRQWFDGMAQAQSILENLPSAQPEPIKITIDHAPTPDELERLKQAMRNTPVMLLPPAQPEIVRCKDCKHSEFWYRDKRRCFLWHEEGIDVFEDGFCNYAERRTDE